MLWGVFNSLHLHRGAVECSVSLAYTLDYCQLHIFPSFLRETYGACLISKGNPGVSCIYLELSNNIFAITSASLFSFSFCLIRFPVYFKDHLFLLSFPRLWIFCLFMRWTKRSRTREHQRKSEKGILFLKKKSNSTNTVSMRRSSNSSRSRHALVTVSDRLKS